MTDEEYLSTQHQLTALARMVAEMDLAGFISRISYAEGVGPILDPTLYMKAIDNLQKIKRLAVGASKFQKAALEVLDG
jgi:hypothetical protein